MSKENIIKTLIEQGIPAGDAEQLGEVLTDYPFLWLDNLNDALKIIRKGEK